ncbi:unnamed protein product [Caenorhabditis angaria]|uniref:Thymidylate kinase n=1 Tax=Caenorhabditis angaria TaxID=860376 RepID=A0A9P1MZX2_9PELO|nr:unnamed protein product [Caenorhabditis angaria]
MTSQRRGVLIVFEGLDRSGKSTQAKRLADFLNSQNEGSAVLQAFPERSEPFGQVIDRYLRREIDLSERALHLAFSANRWEKEQMIRDKIEQGIDVICDRYCYSGVAYSLAKGLDENWVRQSDIGLPRPDVVLFFEVSPEVARQRGGFGEERLETETIQQKVAKKMEELRADNWKSVNADGSYDDVELAVRKIYSEIDRTAPLTSLEKV